jgi:DNA-binding NtrC family response regulator
MNEIANAWRELPRDFSIRTLREVEDAHILATFNHMGKSMTATAAALGISRATLYRRMDKIEGAEK